MTQDRTEPTADEQRLKDGADAEARRKAEHDEAERQRLAERERYDEEQRRTAASDESK